MTSKNIYVVHGYQAASNAHWFPWLERQLVPEGHHVYRLSMPEPAAPSLPQWLQALQGKIGTPGKHDCIVAHSLGCISVLQYLNSLAQGQRIGGLLLVAGFCDPVPGLPELDPFSLASLDFPGLRQRLGRCAVIASRNDDSVPYTLSCRLAAQLQAPLHTVERGGHFLGSEGFTRFPLALQVLREMLAA